MAVSPSAAEILGTKRCTQNQLTAVHDPNKGGCLAIILRREEVGALNYALVFKSHTLLSGKVMCRQDEVECIGIPFIQTLYLPVMPDKTYPFQVALQKTKRRHSTSDWKQIMKKEGNVSKWGLQAVGMDCHSPD